MKKKGQAAMEFLMTYGWAILVVLIVIGVLAVYFKPSKLTPNKVGFDGSNTIVVPEGQYKFGADGSAQVVVQNNENSALKNATLIITDDSGGSCSSGPINIPAGEKATFSCPTGLSTGNAGSAFKGKMTLTYDYGSISGKTLSGEINAKYE